MQLEHTLSVPAPVDEVWTALLNPEKVAPCMPGATLTGVDGDTFTGTVKVKLGPVALTFKGTGVYVEKDESARRAVIEANAKDTRGNGTVAATITVTLTGDGDRTDGVVNTDMKITGKPAQFGRGMISDVGGKILEQFADCLSKKLGPEAAAPAGTTTEAAESQPNESVPASPPLTGAGSGDEAPAGAFVGPGAGDDDSAQARPNESVPPSPASASPAPTMTSTPPTPSATPSPAAPPQPEAEPLDLMQYAKGSVATRIAPVGVIAILIVVIAVILQRRSGR
ncbi:SRPBCC family protein [Rhodococcus rhodochrous]|uniref:SRPBCC family protein n=1 Tax=Rhodococcus rhodochrous TaxID=1829 RepID=UPI001E2E9E30|nr:SRPBCC family protein [Rhodococcus rhodochrous]MCD2099438.1 SRPBCC family protein [Rhodococcus rhodochrous]MCD2123875.1 SRPBCC family protein [Rhodococcus rhodochrous]MCQ4136413.1 SRPBCC family protein [Rhodococcus rhodochrous]MDJ0020679.1 SRPBCC family protein [Rhodococcus rhodochrous]